MKKVLSNNIFMAKYILRFCPGYFWITIAFSILSSVSTVLGLLYMRFFIDAIIANDSISSLLMASSLFVAWNIIFAMFNLIMQQIITPASTEKLRQKMQTEIFKKTIELDLECFENSEFFDKYNIALQQSDSRTLAVLNSLSSFISSLFSIVSLIVLIISIRPTVLIIVALNVCVDFFVNFRYIKTQHHLYQEKIRPQRESGYVQRIFYLKDFFQELRLFESLNILLINFFDNAIKKLQSLIQTYGHKSIKIQAASVVANYFCNSLAILYLAYKAMQREISLGDFSAGLGSSQQLTNQLLKLFGVLPQLYQHSLYAESFREFMGLAPSIQSGNTKVDARHGISLEFQDVSFRYSSSTHDILHDISFKISAGKKVAFVGENGAGKSTLIKLITRLYMPTHGKIIASNCNISEYDIESYRKAISIVFQNFQVYSFSIAENILMRPVNSSKDEMVVKEALKLVGLFDKINDLPDGIHTMISREFSPSGVSFSGGELQRLAIARAFAQDSQLIILDEPTSGLDPISENELISVLLNSTSEKTIILISHRLNNIVKADEIHFIKNGILAESGTHEELMRKGGEYSKMFKIQARGYTTFCEGMNDEKI